MSLIKNYRSLIIIICLSQLSCTGLPDDIKPVDNFQLARYLGSWYEISRLNHSFEKGLSNVTADYSLRGDGGVSVVNKGYSADKKQWNTAEGKAYFVDGSDIGHLKVSFFGPFYGAYVIFELDASNYQYAFVTSYNKEFLWLLSRTPTVSDDIMQRFKALTRQYGFDEQAIIYVSHDDVEKTVSELGAK